MTFPNQRIVSIVPRQGDVEYPYGTISRRECTVAARLLNDKTAAHILYFYFAINRDTFNFALSPTSINRTLGLTEKQYRRGIERLKETGYLVPRGDRSNVLYFYRIPLSYREAVDFEDECEAEPVPTVDEIKMSSLYGVEGNEAETEADTNADANTAPAGIAVIPEEWAESTPVSIDHGTLTGERNIINSINNTSNTEEIASLDNKEVLNDLIQSFRNRFGHLEKCDSELMGVDARARRRRYSIETHIQLLQKKYQQLEEHMEQARRLEIRKYERTVEATLPKDAYGYMVAKLTLQRAAKEYGVPIKYGAWIKGWNEELQRPDIYFAANMLPLEQVERQSHNIAGIPKWYWKGESPPAKT